MRWPQSSRGSKITIFDSPSATVPSRSRSCGSGWIDRQVAIDLQRPLINLFGDPFRRRTAIVRVVLDSEIAICAARIVAGRENQAPERGALADHRRHGGRRKNASAGNHDGAKSVCGRDAQYGLNRGPVVIPPVAADDQCLLAQVLRHLFAHDIENRLDEVFDIAGLRELPCLFTQARRAGALILSGVVGTVFTSFQRLIRRCFSDGLSLQNCAANGAQPVFNEYFSIR